jgi:hypothetical protein
MKKNLFLLALLLYTTLFKAQFNFYVEVKKMINISHPEINLENKLIAVNVLNLSNKESKDATKQFEKAYSVYEYAKLKGGKNGFVSVSVIKEELSSMITISLKRDNIIKTILLKVEDISFKGELNFSNYVFNSVGNVVYKDLPTSKIFESINSLITR